MTRIFVFTNHKGGMGKSTSATNTAFGIASMLRRAGAPNVRVLLIDTDSQSHATLVAPVTLEIGFVLAAMRSALTAATPTICNSDQGSHFTSPQYTQLLMNARKLIDTYGYTTVGKGMANLRARVERDPDAVRSRAGLLITIVRGSWKQAHQDERTIQFEPAKLRRSRRGRQHKTDCFER
jgi:hypothetical protein